MRTDDDRVPPFSRPADPLDPPLGSSPGGDSETDPAVTLSRIVTRQLAVTHDPKEVQHEIS